MNRIERRIRIRNKQEKRKKKFIRNGINQSIIFWMVGKYKYMYDANNNNNNNPKKLNDDRKDGQKLTLTRTIHSGCYYCFFSANFCCCYFHFLCCCCCSSLLNGVTKPISFQFCFSLSLSLPSLSSYLWMMMIRPWWWWWTKKLSKWQCCCCCCCLKQPTTTTTNWTANKMSNL